MYKRNPRRRIRFLPLSICIAVLLVLTGGGALAFGWLLPQFSKLPFMSNYQVIGFHDYFALEADVPSVIIDDRRVTLSMPPFVTDAGTVYLPATFVNDYMDSFLFWDEYAQALFATTRTDIRQYTPGALEYRLNGEKRDLETPIRLSDGAAYLPANLVEALYPYDITYHPAFNIVLVTDLAIKPSVGELTKKADIRYRPDKKAPIEIKAEKGDQITMYDEEGDYTRIRTADGLLGYVLTSSIRYTSPPEEVPDSTAKTDEEKPLWPAGVKINLMWEAVYSVQGTEQWMGTALPDGLNVISPTWFSLDVETMDIVSYGSRAYTDWAHEQQAQVWAMFSDDDSDRSHRLLTDAALRRRTVNRLVELIDEYNLDGINIDFEHVREADGGYYIQFLRELAIETRRKAVILSVDVYVPAAWSAYYERGKIGQTVDFVCVMTYDEHYSGSDAGPVASLPFVQQGVEDMLKEVPKEKLLMGMPYYNRLWREIVGGDTQEKPGVQHFGMEYMKKLINEKGVVPEWDPMAGSYYGEYAAVEEEVTVLYRIWVEDEYSIAEKLKIFESNDLAGLAGWRRGFENEAVWTLLKNTCKLP